MPRANDAKPEVLVWRMTRTIRSQPSHPRAVVVYVESSESLAQIRLAVCNCRKSDSNLPRRPVASPLIGSCLNSVYFLAKSIFGLISGAIHGSRPRKSTCSDAILCWTWC